MANSNVMVIGAGRYGKNIAIALSKKDKSVTLIDKDPNALVSLDDFPGFVACCNGKDIQALLDNGIDKCDEVVLASDDDDLNIFLADYCNIILHTKNICVKLDDSRKKSILDSRIIVISPFDLFIKEFVEKQV